MARHHCRECDRDADELYSVGSGRFWCKECSDASTSAVARREAQTPFERWLADGYAAGWVGPIICHTHDSVPTSAAEDVAWETGDPCLSILRLYANADEKAGVEANHPPSRKHP
jgi:hypothetical protein